MSYQVPCLTLEETSSVVTELMCFHMRGKLPWSLLNSPYGCHKPLTNTVCSICLCHYRSYLPVMTGTLFTSSRSNLPVSQEAIGSTSGLKCFKNNSEWCKILEDWCHSDQLHPVIGCNDHMYVSGGARKYRDRQALGSDEAGAVRDHKVSMTTILHHSWTSPLKGTTYIQFFHYFITFWIDIYEATYGAIKIY